MAKNLERLSFSWRKTRWQGWVLVVIFFVLFSFFIIAAQTPMQNGEPRSPANKAAMVLLLVPWTVWFGYLGLVDAINSTTIVADGQEVARSSGPLPATKSVSISAQSIQQFAALPTRRILGTIVAIAKDDIAHTLVANLPSQIAANQIAHEFNRSYGIEERPIAGVAAS